MDRKFSPEMLLVVVKRLAGTGNTKSSPSTGEPPDQLEPVPQLPLVAPPQVLTAARAVDSSPRLILKTRVRQERPSTRRVEARVTADIGFAISCLGLVFFNFLLFVLFGKSRDLPHAKESDEKMESFR